VRAMTAAVSYGPYGGTCQLAGAPAGGEAVRAENSWRAGG